MRLKLFLLVLLAAALPTLAQKTGVTGTVVNVNTGAPVDGASVMLNSQSIFVTTASDGTFTIDTAHAGNDVLVVAAFGYNDVNLPVEIKDGRILNLDFIQMTPSLTSTARSSRRATPFITRTLICCLRIMG